MKVERVFVDLDGVLADWVGGVTRLLRNDDVKTPDWSISNDMAKALGISGNAMWSAIDTAGESFWAELEPFPWAEQLWARAKAAGPAIVLTSPSHHPSSLAGKLQWMNEHLGHGKPFRDFLIGPRKDMCAAPGSLLIDDRASSCRAFEEAGGQAVLFPRPWNSGWSMAQYRRDPMNALVEVL